VPEPSRFKPITSSRSTSRPIKDRLTQALFTLTSPPHRLSQRLTISSLCRLACVSRNTLYRYYPDMAEAVRRSRRRRGAGLQAAQESTLRSLRSELSMLRGQLAKLATLADHYHAAAEELRALLARRDRELAALRERLRPTPVRIHR
jgi:AcrR family transcriptional regulator